MQCGLDCAIINPHSAEMMKAWHGFMALTGRDANCCGYINFASDCKPAETKTAAAVDTLDAAIIKGLKDSAYSLACEMLKTVSPLEIIDNMIIPALNTVGKGFEAKRFICPSFL